MTEASSFQISCSNQLRLRPAERRGSAPAAARYRQHGLGRAGPGLVMGVTGQGLGIGCGCVTEAGPGAPAPLPTRPQQRAAEAPVGATAALTSLQPHRLAQRRHLVLPGPAEVTRRRRKGRGAGRCRRRDRGAPWGRCPQPA